MTQSPHTAGRAESYAPEEHFLPTYRATNMLAQPSWRFILSLVALKHGVMQREILGPYRNRAIVAARHEAIAMTYQHTQLSMPAVGRLFARDHTTVLHALKKTGGRAKLVEKPAQPPVVMIPSPFSRPYAYRKHGPDGKFQPRPLARTALQRAVLRAYKNNIPPSAVAEEYGCNPLSVKVIAHHLGVKRRKDYRVNANYFGIEATEL